MIKHITVYKDPEVYAGWPANHGAWQWGNEFLVGFLTGRYGNKRMHNILEPFTHSQARSLDGGETWVKEPTYIPDKIDDIFATKWSTLNNLMHKEYIVKFRGSYDHGGDRVPYEGRMYVSSDRGRVWKGPYYIGNNTFFDRDMLCTTRTSVLRELNLAFLSESKINHWGTDRVVVAKFDKGQFNRISVIEDEGRVVMPVTSYSIGGDIFCVTRRRKPGTKVCWVDCYISTTYGNSWKFHSRVGETGERNGNPPAFIGLDNDTFVCCYANRSTSQLIAKVLKTNRTWSDPIILRETTESDIGYPQLFQRLDGKLVCVYYWSDSKKDPQHIESTIFEV